MTAFRETKGNNLLNLGVVYEDKCAGDSVECDHLKLILTEDTPRKPRRKYGKGSDDQLSLFDVPRKGAR
jgi:hypothetical protein